MKKYEQQHKQENKGPDDMFSRKFGFSSEFKDALLQSEIPGDINIRKELIN